MNTNEFLKATEDIAYAQEDGREVPLPRPYVICKDGYKISIQANRHMYCVPKRNRADSYSRVELGYPNREDDLIADYAEVPWDIRQCIFGYVPVEIVDRLLEKHGGIDHWE